MVETRGFNGKSWLDQLGRPSTDALHVTERFHRKDFGHMELRITIDDPKAYVKPFVTKPQVFKWNPKEQVDEQMCVPSEAEAYWNAIGGPAAGTTTK